MGIKGETAIAVFCFGEIVDTLFRVKLQGRDIKMFLRMGTFLKMLAIVEMLAAIVWAVIVVKSVGEQCQQIGDILARIQCEEMSNSIASGQNLLAVYIIAAGAAGALVFFALGHISQLVEAIYERTCKDSASTHLS